MAQSIQDFGLILGMPGTGKSKTIAAILQSLVSSNHTILLVSYTHSAIDNVLLRISPTKNLVLRLGNVDRVDSKLKDITLNPQSVKDLDELLKSVRIIAVTALGVNQ